MLIYREIIFYWRCFLLNIVSVIKFFLVSSFLFSSPPVLSLEKIVLNTGFRHPVSNSSQLGYADQIVIEAFRRIGYDLETVRIPAERALLNANRGIEDGDLIRVAGLDKIYTNLIRVPEHVMVIDMVLFSKKYPDFKVNDWGSIASHSLAIVSGWKIMEKNFAPFSDKIEIIKTDNADQSFSLLENDRVDFLAYSNWSGLGYLEKHNILGVHLLSPPLASIKFYVYLHKRHKKLVSKLSDSIKVMREEGTIDKIYDKTLKPYLLKK